MSRPALYALFGPAIGLAFALWGLVPLANWATGGGAGLDGGSRPDLLGLGLLLPLAYGLGVIPAFLTGAFDLYLLESRRPLRPLAVTLCGFFATMLPLTPVLFVSGPFALALLGLVGLVPALACSLLADVWLKHRRGGENKNSPNNALSG